MNVYDKLASCKLLVDNIPEDTEIYVDYVHGNAELINAGEDIIKAFNDAKSLDKKCNDKVIKSIWVYMDFDLLSSVKLNLKLFVGIREFISDRWKCDFTTIAENKVDRITNDEDKQFHSSDDPLMNKEYYNSFLGCKYEDDYSIDCLKRIKYKFIRAKRERAKQLHQIQKILKMKRYKYISTPKLEYDISMGLHYMIGDPLFKSESSKTMDEIITESLGRLNDNYLRSKITTINTELAFINANLKKFNKLINDKKRRYLI